MEQTRKGYELPGPFKITALRHLMVGKAKGYFEVVEIRNPGDYERVDGHIVLRLLGGDDVYMAGDGGVGPAVDMWMHVGLQYLSPFRST